MLKPPFKLASALDATVDTLSAAPCFPEHTPGDDTPSGGRARLADLDPYLHCSVIGTCLSTGELRKLMARFVFVRDSGDLEVHHEAVRFAGQGGAIAKALHKTLDQRHAAVIQRFAKAREPQALAALWGDALRLGEVPGAYWAVLTHREITPALRQQAFGEVHMLSHLVGAANRADIRRLVALERENAELRDRLERQQARTQELLDERERTLAQRRDELAAALAERDAARAQA
ncbi:MAG TPA: DUF2325 domain-containing protein, partial [Burkholderiaceae bacterium]|nr:DUF2325 domain-containing protein [Burkholderiaceae bacterium]